MTVQWNTSFIFKFVVPKDTQARYSYNNRMNSLPFWGSHITKHWLVNGKVHIYANLYVTKGKGITFI